MLTTSAPTARRMALTASCVAAITAGALGTAVPAHADAAVAPKSSQVTIVGAGWGHGKGMSQYGAYGAASKGLDYAEIIDFYYPGTTLDELADGNRLQVWISADTDNMLHFRPVDGLRVTGYRRHDVDAAVQPPSTASGASSSPGGKRVLQYLTSSRQVRQVHQQAQRQAPLVRRQPGHRNREAGACPNGDTRDYRGKLALRFSDQRREDGQLPDDGDLPPRCRACGDAGLLVGRGRQGAGRGRPHLRGQAALQLPVRARSTTSATPPPARSTRAWPPRRTARTRRISATANKVVKYKGDLALTMFSSSNGGWSASGGADYPYLKAQKDPYDGLRRDQSWSVTLSSAKVEKAYASIGTLKSVQVTQRDGDGTYGGRVDAVKVTGSKGSVTVSGGSFKSKFGLKERLFKLVGGADPSTRTANYLHWIAPRRYRECAGLPHRRGDGRGRRLRAGFETADLWWSADTGCRLLTGTSAPPPTTLWRGRLDAWLPEDRRRSRTRPAPRRTSSSDGSPARPPGSAWSATADRRRVGTPGRGRRWARARTARAVPRGRRTSAPGARAGGRPPARPRPAAADQVQPVRGQSFDQQAGGCVDRRGDLGERLVGSPSRSSTWRRGTTRVCPTCHGAMSRKAMAWSSA